MSSVFKLAPAALLCALAGTSAVSAQAISLPLKAQDLGAGERYRTIVHTAGVQALGKDINGMRHVKEGSWSFMTEAFDAKAGAPARKVTDYVIYNKPFYAMAAGTVVGCWRMAPENTPGSLHPWLTAKLMAGGGNHLWIEQDDGNVALYAHAATGSIDPDICPNNKDKFDLPTVAGKRSPDIDPAVVVPPAQRVRVAKGQFLGRVGNSGSSAGGPHLHVHLERNGQPAAMRLERGLYQEIVDGKVDIHGKWLSMSGKDWPEARVLFWPPRSIGPKLTWNGLPSREFQTWFDHYANSGFMADTLACRESGSTLLVDSTWVPAKGAWYGYSGLTTTDYTAKKAAAVANGFAETAHYTCNTSNGPRHATVLRK